MYHSYTLSLKDIYVWCLKNAFNQLSFILVKPSFIHPREMKLQEHMIVLPGENIHFSCEATSRESTITYHWSKEVQSNSSGQLRLEAILNYYNQSDLMLQNIQQGNVGKYTCVVENVYGNRTANFRLKIFQSGKTFYIFRWGYFCLVK